MTTLITIVRFWPWSLALVSVLRLPESNWLLMTYWGTADLRAESDRNSCQTGYAVCPPMHYVVSVLPCRTVVMISANYQRWFNITALLDLLVIMVSWNPFPYSSDVKGSIIRNIPRCRWGWQERSSTAETSEGDVCVQGAPSTRSPRHCHRKLLNSRHDAQWLHKQRLFDSVLDSCSFPYENH